MQSAEPAGDREHASGWGSPIEMLAVDAPGGGLAPGELQHLIMIIAIRPSRSDQNALRISDTETVAVALPEARRGVGLHARRPPYQL
jgi:hypothetical protein